MDRTQFTFYESFYHGIRGLRTRGEQAAALFAICEYALYGTEPGNLPGSAGAVLAMARPVLDAARRKAEAGKQGGSKGKANGKQTEAKPKQEQGESPKAPKQEKEQVQEQVQVQDKEQMLYTPPPVGVGVYKPPKPEAGAKQSEAVRVYCELISPTPSPASMQELMEFERNMDTGCCVRAINAALDAGARNWLYVRQVLRDKQAAGIRTAEEWDRAAADWDRAKARQSAQTEGYDPDRMQAPADFGDNEAIFREVGL